MLPFTVEFARGQPVYEQLVYCVKKAILSGQLRPGDTFPSVRQLSAELRINPNTAQKAIAVMQEEGLLRAIPGIGTVVDAALRAPDRRRQDLLEKEVERLVVNAKQLSFGLDELQRAIAHQWRKLGKP